MLRSTCATALLAVLASPALAAESYDNCTGFIDSLPASISTQGTWCLRKDLASGMTSGNAIEVKANNVVIDCNDFKIGGLAAGTGTLTTGIASSAGRQNITVRNCTVRGFQFGTWLLGDNHVVERSRFDLNTVVGIRTEGDGNEIRDNVVTSTGGKPVAGVAMGILADGTGGRVLDNRIHGVSAELNGSNQVSAGLTVMEGQQHQRFAVRRDAPRPAHVPLDRARQRGDAGRPVLRLGHRLPDGRQRAAHRLLASQHRAAFLHGARQLQ